MTSVAINFRNLAIALGIVGLAIGAAFGAGIAYGRTEGSGSTATAGTGTGQTGTGNPFGGGNFGGGQGGAGPGGGGFQGLFGGGTTGTVTAVEGDAITIETAQGSTQVYVGDETAISLLQPSGVSDLAPGTAVIISGDTRDDGGLNADSISQLPPQLEGLGAGTPPNQGGGGAQGGGGGAQGGVPEPTPSPAVQAEPTPTTLPDRTSCDEIRGTEYRSASEREFFLANCVTG